MLARGPLFGTIMGSVDAKLSMPSDGMLAISRGVTLLGSTLVALGSGTNYIYSAYAPQIGARLRVSHTQLNVIGLAGNMGVYATGPVWGRIVDRKGPRIPLISASFCLLIGYLGIKQMYDDGIGSDSTVSALHLTLLIVCGFMTGLGSVAGLSAGINATAKSFSSGSRATTTSFVMSGFGLSAFFFSLVAHTLFPGNTSALLLVLAIGTATPMIIGLLIVKPVPLPTSSHARNLSTIEGEPIRSVDPSPFSEEAQAVLAPNLDIDADTDSAPLLSHAQEINPYQAPVPPATVGLDQSVSLHPERNDGDLPDIHGKRLWRSLDFYLAFVIMAICSGTGLMYINNVGSISQALYVNAHPVYNEIEASKWQAAQVSILSVANFVGRILIGLISDFTHTRLRLPRAYCLCLVSFLFIISQATAIAVSSVETLWMATFLLGLAYGSLFGSYPSLVIEWFGLAHFSENWGFVSLSPVLGGNLFSIMFGHILDTHVPPQDAGSLFGMRTQSLIALVSRELPLERQCLDGKACYLESLQVTLVACIVSLGLSWWAGIRDGQKIKARNACVRE